ncbi:MAG: hypothetical protein KGJ13_03410 [Patescibacteria group bacterium]|nr:hypothetical protein [Patescibacteria group bacterium]
MPEDGIFAAIKAAIRFIAQNQKSGGGFESVSSASAEPFSGGTIYLTNFFTANILICLNSIADIGRQFEWNFPGLKQVCHDAADFLLKQRSSRWSFNYWARESFETKTLPYPDDLDDTSLALAALYGFDPALVGGSGLASFVKILTCLEAHSGGPYRTWLVEPGFPDEWRDVDLVVNSNIGYFLSLLGVRLPELRAWIERFISEGRFDSVYYPGTLQVAYALARFYGRGKRARDVVRAIVAEREGRISNPFETALAVSSFVELGFADNVALCDLRVLVKTACKNNWKPHAFCTDPAKNGKRYYAGSAALTAAFAMEALAKYYSARQSIRSSDKNIFEHDVLDATKKIAQTRCDGLPQDLKRIVLRQIRLITDREIVMLPYAIKQALGRRGENLLPQFLESLALANLYGWMAYTIYDDFLDGAGDPVSLSAANYFLRELTLLYAMNGGSSLRFYRDLVNLADDADIWEQLHCRITPEQVNSICPTDLSHRAISNLADRSLAHALPAISILLTCGFPEDGPEINQVLSFFRHYLVARQLHDDARDWREDLLHGRLNSVNARLLRRYPISLPHRMSDVRKEIPDLEKLFWRSEIIAVAADIRSYLALARMALVSIDIFENQEPLMALLDRLERGVQEVLDERALACGFLARYEGNKNEEAR